MGLGRAGTWISLRPCRSKSKPKTASSEPKTAGKAYARSTRGARRSSRAGERSSEDIVRHISRISALSWIVLAACAAMTGGAQPDYGAIVASPDRTEADRQTDVRRKPELLLAF